MLLFIPVGFVQVFIQLPIEILKWLFTGKSFNEPWFSTFIFDGGDFKL